MEQERVAETIAACATELKAVGMTSTTAAYRAMVFAGLAKLAELLPPDQLHSDLVRIRDYLDDLLGEGADDEARH